MNSKNFDILSTYILQNYQNVCHLYIFFLNIAYMQINNKFPSLLTCSTISPFLLISLLDDTPPLNNSHLAPWTTKSALLVCSSRPNIGTSLAQPSGEPCHKRATSGQIIHCCQLLKYNTFLILQLIGLPLRIVLKITLFHSN